jgi:hypothetical protein
MRDFPGQTGGELDLTENLTSRLPAGVPVGLAIFGGKVVSIVIPTTDRRVFHAGIKRIRDEAKGTRPRGLTALYDALIASLTLPAKLRRGDVIYLISDGSDNTSKDSLSGIQGALLASGGRLFAALLRSPSHSERRVGRLFARFAIQASGGDSFEVPADPGNWGVTLSFQSQEIANFYNLLLNPLPPVDKPRDLELNLTGLDKGTLKGLVFHYPQRLIPCLAAGANPVR